MSRPLLPPTDYSDKAKQTPRLNGPFGALEAHERFSLVPSGPRAQPKHLRAQVCRILCAFVLEASEGPEPQIISYQKCGVCRRCYPLAALAATLAATLAASLAATLAARA